MKLTNTDETGDETTKVSLELPLLKLGMKQEPELDDY